MGNGFLCRFGNQIDGAIRAGDDTGLAAKAAFADELDGIADVRQRFGRAGDDARRIVTMPTLCRRRDRPPKDDF